MDERNTSCEKVVLLRYWSPSDNRLTTAGACEVLLEPMRYYRL